MKYKRSKQSTRYISRSAKKSGWGNLSGLKKRSTIFAVVIMLMFSLARIGFIKLPSVSGGQLLERLEKVSRSGHDGRAFGKLSESIADFCFNYLRGGEKKEKAKVFASEEGEKLLPSDANAESVPVADSSKIIHQSLFMPIMPCMGEISSPFGERVHPISGEEKFHKGIDIAVSEGSGIYACEGGTVIVSEYNEYSGNFIKIEHNNGYVSSYSHLSENYTEAGDTVQRGELIALAGSTGIATGPHLHFEILKSGEAQNPLVLIGE